MIISAINLYAVCIPDYSMMQNGSIIIPMDSIYYNQRLQFSLREYLDIFFSSFNSIEFTYLEYGLYGDYLYAINGHEYSTELPLDQLKYLTDVSLSIYSCQDPCSMTINNTKITISSPSNRTNCLQLIAYKNSYISCFSLILTTQGSLSISFEPSLFYPISVVPLQIQWDDSLYSDLLMHQFTTNIGIIDITDIPTLYIPLINRTEVAVTIKTIGGYNTTYTAKIITNNSPVIQLIPNLTGWIDCFVIYNIIATDSDNDSLIYTSDYPIEGNTIVFYGFSIGEFPGIVTVSVRFI